MNKATVIGVTGGFATGKSTVAKIFGRLGAVVISADKIAHDIIMPGEAVYKKVVSLFGAPILTKNGRINRKKLGKIVFNDKRKLLLLNSLIHPEVIKKIEDMVEKKKGVFIIDAPLLIEAGLMDKVDKLVVVTADSKTQIKRSKTKFGLTRADIKRRIRNQMPLTKKTGMADFIIDNNGTLNSTKKEVEKVWREIKNGRKHKSTR